VTISDRAACIVAATTLALALVAGTARAEDSFFDSLAKSAGLMATPPDPPDFIKSSRPKTEPTSIPVFAAPDEPRSKVKSAAELKAMDADLERSSHEQDAIRPKAPALRSSKKKTSDRPDKN
jgi:hypothetical protein